MFKLICVVVISCWVGWCVGLNCQDTVPFKCNPAQEKLVHLLGTVLACPDDTVCNKEQTRICAPCVRKSKNCDGKFTCYKSSMDVVSINGVRFACPMFHECNVNFEDPCKPCVLKRCKENTTFSCKGLDTVVIQNSTMTCQKGFICNKKNVQPCTPCIKEDGCNFPEIHRDV